MVVVEPADPHNGGVWRQGKLLVMHKQATLPDRCVKSNQPAHGRKLKRNLYWHHPPIFLTLFVSPLIYIILAVVLRKRAVIEIGLSPERFAKRRRAILIGWGAVLTSIAMIMLGVGMTAIEGAMKLGYVQVTVLLGFFVFSVGAVYGLIGVGTVSPQRITENYVWLKGVHRDFLAELPDWPYPR